MTVDFYNLIATERGMPAGWQWFTIRAVDGGDTIVTGAVCTALFKSGPRKGQTKWAKRDRSTQREIVVTREQIRERRAQWQRDSGKCVDCYGTGAAIAGWSVDEGTFTRPCGRCKATGVAP